MGRKQHISFLVVLVVLLTASSCSSDDPQATVIDPIVGIWEMESITISDCNDETLNEEIDDPGFSLTLEFREEGTFKISQGDFQDEGIYIVAGKFITFKGRQTNDDLLEFTLNGDMLGIHFQQFDGCIQTTNMIRTS
ncbi:hypothetical protein [Ekhidna sp.]|uniref:hypothetical protein n=1 Tax=Ekhidna sp. TaxID=2608089 RepID=UPI0035174659